MGALDWLRGGTVAGLTESDDDRAEVAETMLRQEQESNLLLMESVAELELALEDRGWQRLAMAGEVEFTRDGLRRMAALCRLMAIKNPLIKRGLNLRHYYVWGQGVSIAARATGPSPKNPGEQDVNAVVQAFLDDPGNVDALFGPTAREENERALGTDGSLCLSLFTDPLVGRVQVRVLPFDEMVDVISNPDDKADRWFFKRQWTATVVDPVTTQTRVESQVAYYPALGFRPVSRPRFIGGHPVQWDAPVLHVRVNGQRGWTWGIPDAYAAIDWARAYKEFLEDWAKLVKALSRFAWRATTPGSKAQRRALAATIGARPTSSATGDANDIGATAVTSPNVTLEAIPKTGATIDSESGRPLAGMVAAALDVPVTMLLADPGVTGARATAETLDRPTELMAGARRDLWADVFRCIFTYVVDEAVRAPRGPLRGILRRDPLTGLESVALAGDTDRTIDITWPDLDEVDIAAVMKALQIADQIDKTPPLVIARLVLEALGVQDVDEVLADLVDEDGNFVDPSASAGDDAVQRFRRGEPTITGDEPVA